MANLVRTHFGTERMKVLIADAFAERGRQALGHSGIEVVYDPGLKDSDLLRAVRSEGPDVLVVRSTLVSSELLRASSLSLVVRAGSGYNTIDVEAASASGTYVANCPGTNAIAVAELAFGLILALDRRIPANLVDLQRGLWNKGTYSDAGGIHGRTLGLIGLGAVGQAMVPRAAAFGMDVVTWSRSLTPERAGQLGVAMKQSADEVAAESDVVSVHVALSEQTRHLIGPPFFEAMRPGAIFINTSRAEVVDERSLAAAVQGKRIRAGLDVFEGQPSGSSGEVNSALFALDGVIGTHHIGGSTDQAQQMIAEEVVRIIREFRDTGVPPNAVNSLSRHSLPGKSCGWGGEEAAVKGISCS